MELCETYLTMLLISLSISSSSMSTEGLSRFSSYISQIVNIYIGIYILAMLEVPVREQYCWSNFGAYQAISLKTLFDFR